MNDQSLNVNVYLKIRKYWPNIFKSKDRADSKNKEKVESQSRVV